MRVLIVEDDYLQAEWLQEVLSEQYRPLEVERIRSENEFRQRFEKFRKNPHDMILLDVMLRWTDPDSNVPAPEDVSNGGYYRAGLRCERLLRDAKETSDIPIVLYTMLEKNDLAEDLSRLSSKSRYIGKNSDTTLLFNAIQELRCKA